MAGYSSDILGTSATTFRIGFLKAILSATALTAQRTFTFPDISTELVGIAGAQTLATKTLTTPVINGGSATGLTNLSVANVDASGFTAQLRYNGTLAGNIVITFNANDANRTVSLSGNLTVPAAASVSGTNTGDETAASIGTLVNGASAETAPVDGDLFAFADVSASNALKKITWANVKATLATWLETLTATWSNKTLVEATVTASGAATALTVTNTGTGDSVLVQDEAGDATPFLINNAGRVVIGHTSALTLGAAVSPFAQLVGTTQVNTIHALARYSANTGAPAFQFCKSRHATLGSHTVVVAGDPYGTVEWYGSDGTAFIAGATIGAYCDGTPGTNDMPSRVSISVTPDGAAAAVEGWRIDNSRCISATQVAPTNNNASVTLTVANIKAGLLTGTPAAGINYTLPTGTLTDAGFQALPNDAAFDWAVINLSGANTITILAGVGHTVVGNMVVAVSSTKRFRTRKTAANTFVTYNLG
jgi:hypothetical protein